MEQTEEKECSKDQPTPIPKTRLTLEIEDLDTKATMKTRLEFYEDTPDAVKRSAVSAMVDMLYGMGYIGEQNVRKT